MNDSNNPFPKPDIPPDAPADLHILAENMDDMIQSIVSVKGREYATIAITLTTLFQQCAQLERLACEATRLLIENAPPEAIDSDAYKGLVSNHAITHVLADASTSSLTRLVDWYENTSAFKGMKADVKMMMLRIKTDWLDKGHG